MQLFIHSKKILFILITIMLSCHVIFAGGFSPNVQVNPLSDGDPNLWGGKSVAHYGDNVYVLWTERGQVNDTNYSHTYLSTSTDGGNTFNDGVRVSATGNQWFPSLAVDNSGAIYAVWTDETNGAMNGISFAKSGDGGVSFSSPYQISSDGAIPVIAVNNNFVFIHFITIKENDQIGFYFARSVDGGDSFEPPYEVSDAPIPNFVGQDMNDIFVDADGNIYCVWNDGRRGDEGSPGSAELSDIYFVKSTDNGVSFGTNIPVNDPTDTTSIKRFGSSVAVHGTNVYVTWLEEVNENYRRVMFARSTNGGNSFEDPVELVPEGRGSPVITVSQDGVIYIAYSYSQPSPPYPMYRDGLFCSISVDGGDSFPVTAFISDQNAYADNPSIDIDENDVLYAVWTDERTREKNVYFSKGSIGPPAAFNLLEPSDGTHYTFTEASTMFTIRWEDVLNLDDNGENQTEYYLFRPALDPHFLMPLGDDYFTSPYEEVIAGELGFLFALLEYQLGEAPDTLDIYWTIAAVNEWGTTWANDTFHVSFEIDNDPPVDGFHLLEPVNDAVVEVEVHGDTFIPVDGEVTFTWNPTTDPDGDEVRYFWLMSDVFPLPDIFDEIFDENDDGPMLIFFPSGRIDDEDQDWDMGGVETHMIIPHEVAYYWFLDGQMEEKTFYWTVIASDGFQIYHWVPSADTMKVTFKPVTTSAQELHVDIPAEFYLGQNYPNPFNPVTTIGFALPVASTVHLEIYNLLGQRIATLIGGEHMRAGTYEIIWNGRDYAGREVSSGVYIYSLTAGDNVQYRRMIMMK